MSTMTLQTIVSRAKPLARRIADSRPIDVLLRMLEAVDGGRPDVLGVLTYHRVAPEGSTPGYPGLISATPEELDAQLSHVASRYRVVAMHDVMEARQRGGGLGGRAVLLTFDDAYRDFADHAWPILRRRRLPATLFVPTGYPGHPGRAFWWDWLYEALMAADSSNVIETADGPIALDSVPHRRTAYARLRTDVKRRPHAEAMELVAELAESRLGMPRPPGMVLDWEALRDLAGDGVTLAPHSRSHALLDRLDPEQLDDEIAGSWQDLRREVGDTLAAFSYPSGSYSDAVRDAVDRAGMRLAFTTRRGLNRLGQTDWLTLRRINVGRASSVNLLRAQLGRWAMAWSR